MCPGAARLVNGEGSWLRRGHLVCHCLLVETSAGLVLVESGLGTGDIADPKRLGRMFLTASRPKLRPSETALHQVQSLGFSAADVRHVVVTHLDVDHAGGIADFPQAQIHVSVAEKNAAERGHLRYIREQLAQAPKWATHEISGERWFGFDAVRAVEHTDGEVLLVPLYGHSEGHCGVAVRTDDGWILHAGDAFFHRWQLQGRRPPLGLAVFQRVVDHDRALRVANQRRLVDLAREHGDEVRIVNAHDPVMLQQCQHAAA